MSHPRRAPKPSGRLTARLDIDLDDFKGFKSHSLVAPLRERYRRAGLLAEHAIVRLVEDLEALNEIHIETHGRVAFTAVQGRVKQEDRFLAKILSTCREQAKAQGVTAATLDASFAGIKDLAGVRFSCPYFDEVVPAVNELVRPSFGTKGYGTDLRAEPGYDDRNYLENGDRFGYRSYHFYVRIPTVVDIYGGVEMCLCEVQARTELQHVWADKSHDLLYKPSIDWNEPDEQIVALMKQVSNNLRAVDGYLVDIRHRVRGEKSS